MNSGDIHRDQPVVVAGVPLLEAEGAMVLLHGRGASAADILSLAKELAHPKLAYLAPQSAGNSWYPYSFLAPIPDNEPGISTGLAAINKVIKTITKAGIPKKKIIIGGFSQGACLALEYVARNADSFGGVIGYSGGLIGPEGTAREYEGSLARTPIFLGCSDVDFHIPKERVELTAQVLSELGGSVTLRFYPGMGHTVNQDEVNSGRAMILTVMGG
jgi:predicted esterase